MRKNISQPLDWWTAFERAADKAGVPLSTWIGRQCKRGLPKDERAKLTERKGPGQPRKDTR